MHRLETITLEEEMTGVGKVDVEKVFHSMWTECTNKGFKIDDFRVIFGSPTLFMLKGHKK